MLLFLKSDLTTDVPPPIKYFRKHSEKWFAVESVINIAIMVDMTSYNDRYDILNLLNRTLKQETFMRIFQNV